MTAGKVPALKFYREKVMFVYKMSSHQVRELIAAAYNASRTAGLGILNYLPEPMKPEEVKYSGGDVDIDYLLGRMVKLYLKMLREEDGCYVFLVPDKEARSDYQSWATKYLTYKELVLSVPGVIQLEN